MSLSHLTVFHTFHLLFLNVLIAFQVTTPVFAQPDTKATDQISFSKDVRPILAKNCLACHGLDESAREADLRLDLRQSAIDTGALVPRKPKESELITRIDSDDEDTVMPPPDTGHLLSDEEKLILRRWILQGGEYEGHWAFELPQKSKLPPVRDRDWPINEIDYFILKRLDDRSWMPAANANRLTWLRRVSLDLTGLPPTPIETEMFLADQTTSAYENVVDRLLKSPAYGEHWARMWLDLARYADTRGYEKDRHRDIWRYRDWVINAFNQDMPFDQFTREQLAGDLLPNRTDSQILATAFHRNTMTNEEGGTDNEEFRVAAVKDRVDTTIQVWMGLTMGCAKCHSHKYDPISLDDYYAFYAFFNQTQDNDTEGPFWPTPTLEQTKKIASLNNSIRQKNNDLKTKPASFDSQFKKWKSQFESKPLWSPLQLATFNSANGTQVDQMPNGVLIGRGKKPEKDTWTITFDLPKTQDINSLRIDHFPKSKAGGDWPDANVALQELTVYVIDENGKKQKVKLNNPRASFSQAGWSVAKAIDGNTKVGWALSPRFNEPHAAVFDFEKSVMGSKIEIQLVQEYGQGLLLSRSRFSVSQYPTAWNQPTLKPDLEDLFARHVFSGTRDAYQQIDRLQKQLIAVKKQVPQTPVLLELDRKKFRKTRIHNRGNFLDPGKEVQAATLPPFGPFPEGAIGSRLGVVDWLMADSNPLTARVMVNRVWARIFGKGIVETEEDFGTQGTLPSHPELLDWLAVHFREEGWSVKNLLRMLVLSRTYRQSSSSTAEQLQRDPRNTWLSRGPRFRLSAETVRDQALAAAGLLTIKIGGPSVMPPQPNGIWKSTYNGQSWKNAVGPDRYRRAIYTYLKRTSPYPSMQTFDAGSGEVCQIRRIRTNTPLQALVVLNDEAFFEIAGGLARRMQNSSESIREQIAFGFRCLLVRDPTEVEINRLMKLYESIQLNPNEQTDLLEAAKWKEGDHRLVLIANVLLNLDESLTKP